MIKSYEHLAKKYEIELFYKNENLNFKSKKGLWYVVKSDRKLILYHESNLCSNTDKAFHKQKIFYNNYDIVQYIHKHDIYKKHECDLKNAFKQLEDIKRNNTVRKVS